MWTKENIPDQSGKTVLVTGANSGIGFETALAFYQVGAHVIMASRDERKAVQAATTIKSMGGEGSLETGILNLASLSDVKQFADHIRERHSQLHLLINNAGVMTPPASKTVDGFELQFGVNFLGHFALTGHLYPLLRGTSGSRIVTLTSLAYQLGTINITNLRLEKSYDPQREYAQSKLADLVFSLELQRRITSIGDAVLSLAAHPGVTKTDLSRYMSQEAYEEATYQFGPLMETSQGALPTLYAAVSAAVRPGGFYGPDQDGGLRGYPAETAILQPATDEELGQILWLKAESITGIKYPL